MENFTWNLEKGNSANKEAECHGPVCLCLVFPNMNLVLMSYEDKFYWTFSKSLAEQVHTNSGTFCSDTWIIPLSIVANKWK